MEWMEKSVWSDLWQKNEGKTKGKVYKTVVRPAMLYGPETVAMT